MLRDFLITQKDLMDKTWLPHWYAHFCRDDGLFHERLDHNDQPLGMGQIRLVTQTRQIFSYSVGSDCSRRFGNGLEKAFAALQTKFAAPDSNGLYYTALDTGGKPKDATFDFYAHAFVILSSAFYYKASGSVAARNQASQTLDRILTDFAIENGQGFYEALGADKKPLSKTRRQNPHMHLLEACLFAYDITGEGRYAEVAKMLGELALQRFIRPALNDTSSLSLFEFFTDDLVNLHPTEGYKVEGGHHYEWIWLLDKIRTQLGDNANLRDTQRGLYTWALNYGHDADYGGIFDTVDARSGAPILPTKRIWPITEAVKALAIATRDGYATQAQFTDWQKLWTHYLPQSGSWNETFNRDLDSLALDHRPASTPYHIINGVLEGVRILG